MNKIDVALENTKRILEDDKARIVGRLEAEKKALDSTFSGLDLPEDEKYVDVRLRIQNPSQGHLITWALKFGDSSFDQDHRGFWACGSIDQYTDPEGLFQDLKNEVLDYIAMTESDHYDL